MERHRHQQLNVDACCKGLPCGLFEVGTQHAEARGPDGSARLGHHSPRRLARKGGFLLLHQFDVAMPCRIHVDAAHLGMHPVLVRQVRFDSLADAAVQFKQGQSLHLRWVLLAP